MRIIIRLNERETVARTAKIAAHPDAVPDRAARIVGEAAWRTPGTGAVEAVDLEDASGAYLYTILGDPR